MGREWMMANSHNQNSKKNKKQKSRSRLYILDVCSIIAPIVFFIVELGSCIYLYANVSVAGMDVVIDFIVAAMSGLLLLFSFIKIRFKTDEKKYIYWGNTLMLVFSVGFLIILVMAERQVNGDVARIISLICLLITSLVEVAQYVVFEVGYARRRRDEREKE